MHLLTEPSHQLVTKLLIKHNYQPHLRVHLCMCVHLNKNLPTEARGRQLIFFLVNICLILLRKGLLLTLRTCSFRQASWPMLPLDRPVSTSQHWHFRHSGTIFNLYLGTGKQTQVLTHKQQLLITETSHHPQA